MSAKSLRLDRLLANLGYGSRREVGELVRRGAVRLDGERLNKPDQHIELQTDFTQRLTVNREPLDPFPGLVLMLHKPLGVTCSHKEAGELVYDLLPERWRRRSPPVSAIGRLDKETSGLLLMTDDGTLLHRIISPRSEIPKRYHAILDRPLTGKEGEMFASGTLMLDGEDKPLLPAKLEVLGETEAFLTITEGRYHQVRRMFAALGNHVMALHRDRIGGLELPAGLAPGEFRLLDESDVDKIFRD